MKTRILAGCMAFTMLSACTSEKIEMGTLSEQHERQEKNTELVLFYSGEILTGLLQWKNYAQHL